MTSVQTTTVHEMGYGVEDTSSYHAIRRTQLRKQHNQHNLDEIRSRSSPILDKLQIPCEFAPIKRIISPISPVPSLKEQAPFTEYKPRDKIKVDQQAPIKELYVSPHPDDICYSCFSTVTRDQSVKNQQHTIERADNGRVIVTVFSKSRCANGELGEQLKRNVEDITRVRKVEDENFAKTVGCNLKQLGLPDSSARDEYSRWTHLADEDLQEQHRVVKDHPRYLEAEKSLSSVVRWAVHCKAAIYMPMAVGCHVDHLMTRVAVTCIMDQIKSERKIEILPIRLTYYEDLPYAYYVTEESIQKLAKAVLPVTATSKLIPVDANTWQRKKEAVMAYETQMKPIILPALHDRAITLATLEKDAITNNTDALLRERIWIVQ